MAYESPAPREPSADGFAEWELDLIRLVVRDFVREQGALPGLAEEDLFQEAMVHWWQQRRRWTKNRGASKQTYLRQVARSRLADLAREARALKRGSGKPALSLEMPSGQEDNHATLSDLLPASEDEEAQILGHMERDRLLARLNQLQRHLAQALESGRSMSEIRQITGVPRTTLYDELGRIRRLLKDDSLEGLLE